jgi:hypothetical protein
MNEYQPTKATSASDLLVKWRDRHPELTDEQFEEAMTELKAYLRLAWEVYRQQHPDRDLPETL